MKNASSILDRLRKAYGTKEFIDRKISVSRLIYRPISFYLAVPFVWLDFTANGVTLFRFIVAMIGCIFLAIGGSSSVLIGSIILFFAVLLDFVDGNIARFRGETSHLGKFLEDVTDTIIKAIIPLAVSVGLYSQADYFLTSLNSSLDPALILIVGAVASISIAFQSILTYRLNASLLELEVEKDATVTKKISADSSSFVQVKPKISQRLVNLLIFLLIRESYFMLGGIIFFGIFNVMSIFLFIRCFASVIHFILTCAQTLVRARRSLGIYRAF